MIRAPITQAKGSTEHRWISFVDVSGSLAHRRCRRLGRNISILAAALLLFSSAMASRPWARTADKLVCDVAADVALESQDYPTAIGLHRKFLRLRKNNALAHCHLGFPYGMTGNVSEEIREYRTAISLGLNAWDLFLNLGLAYYDQHDLPGATAALATAVLFGPEHAETHFNLAVIYEKENRLPEALQEISKANQAGNSAGLASSVETAAAYCTVGRGSGRPLPPSDPPSWAEACSAAA